MVLVWGVDVIGLSCCGIISSGSTRTKGSYETNRSGRSHLEDLRKHGKKESFGSVSPALTHQTTSPTLEEMR